MIPIERPPELVSVQPFRLAQNGGGPRILRSMLADAPIATRSIAVLPSVVDDDGDLDETVVSLRPRLPLEHTRLGPWLTSLDVLAARSLEKRLRDAIGTHQSTIVHAVAHNVDFAVAQRLAATAGQRFILSVHDDIEYALRGRPHRRLVSRWTGTAWREASARLVISDALGEEYDWRYGRREWTVVTDGARGGPLRTTAAGPGGPVLYFAGALHLSYHPNFDALLRALDDLGGEARLVLRGSGTPIPSDRVQERPFSMSDAELIADLGDVDFAYLPLPFAQEHDAFIRTSLPTKLISYLTSGRPILVHAPSHAAAARLVTDHGAGIVISSLEPTALQAGLREAHSRRAELLAGAAALLEKRFSFAANHAAFWRAALGPVEP